MMKVKPAEGLKIRDPITTQFIDPDGWEVDEKSLYWFCRLRDGDVVPADGSSSNETSSPGQQPAGTDDDNATPSSGS
jgi:hypothetical protein